MRFYCCPAERQDRQALETMVTEINAREVRKQDVLSNHVYQYQKNFRVK